MQHLRGITWPPLILTPSSTSISISTPQYLMVNAYENEQPNFIKLPNHTLPRRPETRRPSTTKWRKQRILPFGKIFAPSIQFMKKIIMSFPPPLLLSLRLSLHRHHRLLTISFPEFVNGNNLSLSLSLSR